MIVESAITASAAREGADLPAFFLLQAEGGSALQNPLIPVILMVVVFYLVLFLPMRRRQRKMEAMLKNLRNGDQVATSGGLIGTIVGIGDDNTITLRVKPDNVKLQLARNSVTSLLNPGEEQK